ncbi:MAG TPA: ABC transporter ATP-binding protein [Candidatus Gemmiger stercoravium]|nr:ABC transporter ATP-binding protein [Candidatus Gemmiger stercoravium]
MTQKNNPPAGPGAPLLQVRGLGRVYGRGEAAVTALQDVNFSVERGSFVSIVGPSGSGKSTLLHLIGGVDRPTAGTVFVDGTDLGALPESRLAVFRRRQIGLVYQFYNLIPALTVEENLTLPLLLDRRPIDRGHLMELAARLGLADKLHALPSQLSGGQQQRVSVGRALITRPALLLADEPTGNLDTKNSAAILALLQQFHRQLGQTLLLITHDPAIARQADRVLSLRDGRLEKDEVMRP